MLPAKLPPNSPASAAPATPEGAAPDDGKGGFDVILTLEALAASASAFDGVALDAAGAPADGAADGSDTDTNAEDPEGMLALLAGLLAMNSPVPQAGAAPHGGTGEGADALTTTPTPGDPEASGAPVLLASADEAARAARTLADGTAAAQAALQNLGGDTAPADDTAAASRTSDLFAHTLRHAPTTPLEQATIATHVRDPRWAEELGTRVSLMLNKRESVASLQLTPLDLGPVDVSVTVRDSQATIHFGAAQADTRALLEASLPRLREMLAAQGFNLLDASVSQGFTRQPRGDAPAAPRAEGDTEVTAVASRAITLSGLLDVYA